MNDPKLNALPMNVVQDEDEARHAEPALTTHLLHKGDSLSPNELALLLTLAPDDPAVAALQDAVHKLVVERLNSTLNHDHTSPPGGPDR